MANWLNEKSFYDTQGWSYAGVTLPTAVTNPFTNYAGFLAQLESEAADQEFLHGVTEGDDLWTHLQMYQRTGNSVYLDMATAWAHWWVNHGRASSAYSYDLVNYGGDHLYGHGLVDWYEYADVAAALTTAQAIAGDIETTNDYAGKTPGDDSVTYWGTRSAGRHLLLLTRLSEVSGGSYITQRNQLVDLLTNDPQWDATFGIYWWGREQCAYGDAFPWASSYAEAVAAYDDGWRACSPFEIAWLVFGLAEARRVCLAAGDTTRAATLRTTIIGIADFLTSYGLAPGYQQSEYRVGVQLGTSPVTRYGYSSYSDPTPPTTNGWSCDYTKCLVNPLMYAYQYTGTEAYKTLATACWKNGSTWNYVDSGTSLTAPPFPDVADHFADTTFLYIGGNYYVSYQHNKGEWHYVSQLFETVASPTYISDMTAYQVRNLTGTYAPTNGYETLEDITPAEWLSSDPGTTNLYGVINPWCGGAKPTTGTTLYVHGGGHQDSANNGLYCFDFSGTTAPIGWSLPAISAVSAVRVAASYTDGRPSAAHTYDGMVTAANGTIYRFGGALYWNAGFRADAWKYTVGTATWTQLTSIPEGYGENVPMTIYDPASNKVLITMGGYSNSSYEYRIFRIDTGTYSAVKEYPSGHVTGSSQCGAYDTSRSRALFAGEGNNQRITVDWTAETATIASQSLPGVPTGNGLSTVYDSVLDVYWIFGGAAGSAGWSTIYEVDAGTFAVTAHALTGNSISQAADMWGSYGRFVFLGTWRAIGLVADIDTPVSVIRLPSTGAPVGTITLSVR